MHFADFGLYSQIPFEGKGMERVLLGLNEASEYANVGVSTLRSWIRARRFPIVRAGRLFRVNKRVLDARIAAGELTKPAPGEIATDSQISLDKPSG